MTADRRGDLVRLADILSSLKRISLYTKGGREEFLASPKTQDAVIRNLEVIGEAAGKLTGDLRSEYPGVPWAQLRGFASFSKHEYWKIDVQLLWAAVEEIPGIERKVAQIRVDRGDGPPARTRS